MFRCGLSIEGPLGDAKCGYSGFMGRSSVVSWANGRRLPRPPQRKRGPGLGRYEDFGRPCRRAARTHIRGGAGSDAREGLEVPPSGVSSGRAGGASPHPRILVARLLREGRRLASAGGSGVAGGGGGRLRYRPGRGGRGRGKHKWLLGGRGVERILPARGPGGPGAWRLPLVARPPAALSVRGGRGRGSPAPEGTARGSGFVVRTLLRPRR